MHYNFKRIFLSLILLALIASFYTCSEDDGLVIVSGTVIDSVNQETIQNVSLKVERDRCGLTSLQNCERINMKDLSDDLGNFRMAFREECPHELQVSIPLELKEQYPMSEIIIEEISDRYLYRNCHENILLYKSVNYKLNVIIQPQILLTLIPVSMSGMELTKIEIPQFGIISNGLIDTGISKILDIESYVGSFDILLSYADGSTITKNVKYDYHFRHVIQLNIET